MGRQPRGVAANVIVVPAGIGFLFVAEPEGRTAKVDNNNKHSHIWHELWNSLAPLRNSFLRKG